jgi:hypothetical protein
MRMDAGGGDGTVVEALAIRSESIWILCNMFSRHFGGKEIGYGRTRHGAGQSCNMNNEQVCPEFLQTDGCSPSLHQVRKPMVNLQGWDD